MANEPTNEERRAWLATQAEQLGMDEHEVPNLDRVLALLDHLAPTETVPDELAAAALEEVAAAEDEGRELLDVEQVTGDPLAWARTQDIDETDAEQIHQLIGDMTNLPSATVMFEYPELAGPARAAVLAEKEHGRDSAQRETALDDLEARWHEQTHPDPEPAEAEYDEGQAAEAATEPPAVKEKPATPLFDADLAEALGRAHNTVARIHRDQPTRYPEDQHRTEVHRGLGDQSPDLPL